MVDVIALTTASMFVGLAVLLGYLGQRALGAFLLGFFAVIASILCLGGAALGYTLGGRAGAWTGLVLGMIFAGIFIPGILGKVIKGNGKKFIRVLWFGFCALSIYGYLAAGWIGLLTITLPVVVIFWGGIYLLSAFILPLRDPSQRGLAYRSLVTFTMGTNYPYYFVNKYSKPDKRVDGNPFLQFFAGPGFAFTPPDHAAYITNGVSNNRVFEPGLTFTDKFDLEPEIIDLRTQLRAFDVEARTKDGILIKVLVFVPFRIDTGNQQAELGEAFPFRSAAVFKALAHELTERKATKEDQGERNKWDGKLVQVITTPIVQDIISHYTVDELCEPNNPARDPRVEIVNEMRRRVQEALRPRGLEVVGGGISNLLPQEDNVMQRRFENWKTRWQGQILSRVMKGQANRDLVLEGAKAEVEQKNAEYLTKVTKDNAYISVLKFMEALRSLNPVNDLPN